MAVIPIEQWARYALTSDPQSAYPSDADLALLVSEVEARVQDLYPCLVAGGTTPSDLYASNESALNAYNRTVGYLVAARFLPGRAGQKYQASNIVVKIGPVSKSSAAGISVSTQIQGLSNRATEAAQLIPCIASSIADASRVRGNLGCGLAGYRRAQGGVCAGLTSLYNAMRHIACVWSMPCTSNENDAPTSIVIVSVETASSGTQWVAFGNTPCDKLDILNFSGTDIEYRRGGAGLSITIPEGSARLVEAIDNASEVEVRRVDQSTTQVTLTAEAIVE